MAAWAEWSVAVASLAGVVLNIRKNRLCFALWFITNLSWATIDFLSGVIAQAALMLVYAGLAAYGWCAWGKDG